MIRAQVITVNSNFAGAFFTFAINREPARLLRAVRGRLVFSSAASYCLCPLGYGAVTQRLSSFFVFASRIFMRRGNPALFAVVSNSEMRSRNSNSKRSLQVFKAFSALKDHLLSITVFNKRSIHYDFCSLPFL